MKWVMLLLAFLMISHVLYPAISNIGVRSLGQIAQLLVVLVGLSILIFRKEEFLFPALVLYVAWGLGRTLLLGVVDRLPTGDPLYDADDDEEAEDEALARPVSVGEVPGSWRRRKRRRRGRRTLPNPERIPDSE
jgi:CDP-diacylglycerol--serine O-phosphatidyltransferase